MKTTVKTSIKNSENMYVKESVNEIFEELSNKKSFILLTSLSHDNKESQVIIKKSSIKMVKG